MLKSRKKKYIFYRRVIQALFSEHDSKTKIGYRRERKTELTQEQFEEILKRFSFLSFFEAKYDFEYDYVIDILKKIKDKLIETKFDNNKLIGDLKSALALWVEDNGIYGFAHRSMQEYYVANFIKRLDITNKKKIYQKLIERTHETLSSEIENLLSLSEEMDTFYFYSLYKIPLLEQLKKQLENPDSDRVLMNTVSHLVRIIDINFNDKRSNDYAFMHLNSEINRYLYFHLNYMKRLHTKLLPFREYISKGNTSKAKRFQYKIDPHDFPQDLLTYCKKNHFGDLCSEFIAWLDGEIRFAKDFIEKTSQSNDELVAMI